MVPGLFRSDVDRLVNHHGRMEEIKGTEPDPSLEKSTAADQIASARIGSLASNGWMSPRDLVADFNG